MAPAEKHIGTGNEEHDDGVYLSASGPVLVAYFSAPPTVERLARFGRAQRALLDDHERIAVLMMGDSGMAKAMSLEAAREAVRIHQEGAGRIVAVALLMCESSKALLALAKGTVASVRLATGNKVPWRVFHEDEHEGCIEWIASRCAEEGVGLDLTALCVAAQAALEARVDELRVDEARSSSSGRPGALGPYTLRERLGAGGMGEVWLATQSGPGGFEKSLVVKRILPHLVERTESRAAFLREARLAARLSHANVVQVFDAGDIDGTLYLAMEHVDGMTLLALAKAAWRAGKRVPLDVAVGAIADAARGLHHAHTFEGGGLVHRDISPDNLILGSDGVTKVLDFGIAKPGDEGTRLTDTGMIKGKLGYMSPEQLEGAELDGRADLYALGCTLYWLLARRRPFVASSDAALVRTIIADAAPPLGSLAPETPPPAIAVVERLLAKRRDERFSSGRELAAALDEIARPSRERSAAFLGEVIGLGAAPAEPPSETASTVANVVDDAAEG